MEERVQSHHIRESFLRFFADRGHLRLPSSSLVPAGDPTLLLTTAGMVQLKPYFTGEAIPPSRRLTSCQKCFRTTDIDKVGDAKHLTFFEMLGNFSVGDYFKKEAIAWAWEYLTRELGIPQKRLWVSVYRDDDEAWEHWRQLGIPTERLYRYGEEENFWGPAGEEGPCGPCSEIHFDFGEEYSCGEPDCGPACPRCTRFVELWNLVFMQFYHHRDGRRTPLPTPNIDTGMGLERAAAVLQGKTTVFDTDLFHPLVEKVSRLSGRPYGSREETDYAIRVVAEHGRGIPFLIADGVVPSNEGRGYVLRRIIRRALRFGRKLGLEGPFLGEVAREVINLMGPVYPELTRQGEFALRVIAAEESRFHQTLQRGLVLLDELISSRPWALEVFRRLRDHPEVQRPWEEALPLEGFLERARNILSSLAAASPGGEEPSRKGVMELLAMVEGRLARAAERPGAGGEDLRRELLSFAQGLLDHPSRISGDEAFLLYDTYGFPLDITQDVAREHGLEVDLEEFERAMAAQRERARAAQKPGQAEEGRLESYRALGISATPFQGYQTLTLTTQVLGLLRDGTPVPEVREGQEVEVVLRETPFYAEMGGQVGDRGQILGPQGLVQVEDTQSPVLGLIVHRGRVVQGRLRLGDEVEARVDPRRRLDTARNHSATHLLQSALRQVLGPHVRQAGSLVAPDRLRFDFNHPGALSTEELLQVQGLVNDKVRENLEVRKRETSYHQALAEGALAFFGDKYGSTVRVVEMGRDPPFSREVCGGTHVGATGEIGFFLITYEGSIGAGLRRIEAVTGHGAEALVQQRLKMLESLAGQLQVPQEEVVSRTSALVAELERYRKRVEALERQLSLQVAEGLLARVQEVEGVKVLAARVSVSSMEALREMGDWLKAKMGSGILVLGSVLQDRPTLLAMVTRDLVAQGFHAGEMAGRLARVMEGGGGGRAEMAQAGGRRPEKLEEALRAVVPLVQDFKASL